MPFDYNLSSESWAQLRTENLCVSYFQIENRSESWGKKTNILYRSSLIRESSLFHLIMCHPTESQTKTASQNFMDFLDFIKIRFVAEKVPFTSRFSESLNVQLSDRTRLGCRYSRNALALQPKSEKSETKYYVGHWRFGDLLTCYVMRHFCLIIHDFSIYLQF